MNKRGEWRTCAYCGVRSDYIIRQCCIAGNDDDTFKGSRFSVPEPAPVKNELPAVWDLVLIDMVDRDKSGRKKYGTPLQPHNGRDALVDAYQEALDLVVYLRQAIYERNGK